MSKFIVVTEHYDRTVEYLREELDYLGIEQPSSIDVYQVYEVEEEIPGIENIFDDYKVYDSLEKFQREDSFRYRLLPGMYDENEEMVQKLVKDFLKSDVNIHHSSIIVLENITSTNMELFKDYFINDIESEIVPMTPLNYEIKESTAEDLKIVEGFRELTIEELDEFSVDYSMNCADLELTQAYFIEEKRDPSVLELKVIDTYWSDHCRHTTFFTELTSIEVADSKYKEPIEKALNTYKEVREKVYGDKPRDSF